MIEMSKNVQITIGDKTVTATMASVTADGASYEVYIVGKNSKGKNNVAASSNEVVSAVVQPNAPKVNEPKANEPKVNEPKANEPKVNEPKVNEPKVNEVKANEPKVNEPKVNEAKVNNVVASQQEALEQKTPAAPSEILINRPPSVLNAVENQTKGGKRRRTIRRVVRGKKRTLRLKRISRRK
jgi:outer membrane biosynthesis protein TonB